MTDAPTSDIAVLARAFRSGSASPVDHVEEVLDRVSRLNPSINAISSLFAESARRQARTATGELSAGMDRGPLHGVAFTVKDVIDVAGQSITGASAALLGRVPAADADVVRAARDGGAILIGTTNCFELAMAPDGGGRFGPTVNPWDPTRSPRGSSSGSAAAVAAGFGLLSIGTDTRGSVRGPAAACGVTGFKPTIGHLSTGGAMPLSPTLDHVGVLARTASDCAVAMSVLQDRRWLTRPDGGRVHPTEVSSLRVGVLHDFVGDCAHPEHVAALESALSVLEAVGAEVRHVEFGRRLTVRAACASTIAEHELHQQYRHLLARAPGPRPAVVDRIRRGGWISAETYAGALAEQQRIRRRFSEAMDGLDLVVSVTTAHPPPLLGEESTGGAELQQLFNLVGAPAISVPCGVTSVGLPVGMQIAGRVGADDLVLGLATRYQERVGPPPLPPQPGVGAPR
ncbi:amidase [Rhodococcus sp. NPDC055024]